jgi:cation transport ATPase
VIIKKLQRAHAKQVGIDTVIAEVLQRPKHQRLKRFKTKVENCYVGDGIMMHQP